MTNSNSNRQFIPRQTLDGYVTTEIGIVIYQYVKSVLEDCNSNISVLDFMNILYKDLTFFVSNGRKFLVIEEYFADNNLDRELKFAYFDLLIKCLNFLKPEELEEGVFRQSIKYLEDQRWLSILKETNSDNYFGFQFPLISKHLLTLGNDVEREKYLLKSKAAYDAIISVHVEEEVPIFFKSFPFECDFELEKIKALSTIKLIDNQSKPQHKNVQEEDIGKLGSTIIEEPLIRKLRVLFDDTIWEKQTVENEQFLDYWRLGKRETFLPIKNKTNFIHLIRRLTEKKVISKPKQKDLIKIFNIRNYANLLYAIEGKDYTSEMQEINQKIDLTIKNNPK